MDDEISKVRVTQGITLGIDIGIGLAIVGAVCLFLLGLGVFILYSMGVFPWR